MLIRRYFFELSADRAQQLALVVDKWDVTAPRMIFEGETILVTRRCVGRQFRLRPDPVTCHIIKYCLAYLADRYDILLHEFIVMSNHYHILLTDRFRRRSEFFRDLNSQIARAVNASFGDWENLFATGSFNSVTLLESGDVVRKAAYTLLNPTQAGLVKLPEYWDGVTSWSMAYGQVQRIPKPSIFFGDDKPAEAYLGLVRPDPMFPGDDDSTARARLLQRVRQQAHDIAKRVREEGGGFMGMRRVLRRPRHSAPHTHEPRRGTRPTIAAQDEEARVGALEARQEFLHKYRAARVAWQAGDRKVLFPLGTYLMRQRFGVSVGKK